MMSTGLLIAHPPRFMTDLEKPSPHPGWTGLIVSPRRSIGSDRGQMGQTGALSHAILCIWTRSDAVQPTDLDLVRRDQENGQIQEG